MADDATIEKSAELEGWKSEVKTLLRITKEYATLIGVAIATASGASVFNYIRSEGLPINLASSAFLASLPAVSAAIIFLIVILICYFLFPTAVVFLPIESDRPTHMSKVFSGSSKVRRRAKWHLLAFLSAPALLTLLVVLAFSYIGTLGGDFFFGFSLVSSVALCWLLSIRLIGGRKSPGFWKSLDFYYLTVGAVLVQFLISSIVLRVSLRKFFLDVDNIWILTLISLLAIVATVFIQISAAVAMGRLIKTATPLRNIALVVFSIVLAACIFPVSGSFIAGRVMQIMAGGGGSCLVLEWNMSGVKSIHSSLMSTDEGRSVPVRIMAESDGTYFVKTSEQETRRIFKVETAAVSGFEACLTRETDEIGK